MGGYVLHFLEARSASTACRIAMSEQAESVVQNVRLVRSGLNPITSPGASVTTMRRPRCGTIDRHETGLLRSVIVPSLSPARHGLYTTSSTRSEHRYLARCSNPPP